jgi:enterochelin esterase family protein
MFRSTVTIAFGLAITMAVSASIGARQAPTPPPAPAGAPAKGGGRGAAPVISPDVAADGRVTLRLRAPNAREVLAAVSGRQPLPMQKDDQGVWSVTTDALAPDIYTYSFRVDGATFTDPSSREYQTSFGSFQNMFSVPGPQPWLPAANVPRGAVARHVFRSAIAGDTREFFVYTPPGYEPKRSQAYPVLYILHGLGDDAGRWVNSGAANVILDNLIAAKKAVPMVMVSTLGYGTSLGPAGARGEGGLRNLTGYTQILLDEVMPQVDKTYNVSKDRTQRAIAGLSMGGTETLYTGLNNLDKFAWIGSFSGAFTMWPGLQVPAAGAARGERGTPAPPPTFNQAKFGEMFPKLDAKANSQIKMLWIVCGTSDGLIAVNRELKSWLRSKNIAFTEQEVPDMGHVWPLWRQNVADMVPRLFR